MSKTNSKPQGLWVRCLTACILIVLICTGLFTLPPLSYATITALILLLAASEWPRLIGQVHYLRYLSFVLGLLFGLVATLLIAAHSKDVTALINRLLALGGLLWLWLLTWIPAYERQQRLKWQAPWFYYVIGWAILLITWLALNAIRHAPQGPWWVLWFLLLIWGADTSAYFAGRSLGQKQLAPYVSPHKTWAGVYAAFVFALLSGAITAWWVDDSLPRQLGLVALALSVTGFAIGGDLFISVLKRNFALKDTGNLLPGHGGVLDRMDSLLAGAPVFALGLTILGLN